MSQSIIELLSAGAEANTSDMYRQGNVVHLPPTGSLVVSGDLHGHSRNLERIVAYSNLDEHPDRHVILQEIIHGGEKDGHGGCLSFETLFEAVRFKMRFPDQVHILMGNHDTAFMTGSEVMKDGREMNFAMLSAMKRRYADTVDKIELGIRRLLFSQPLAVKCASGIWASHSLPDNRSIEKFTQDIFDRPLRMDDIVRGNVAYSLLWGRNQSQSTVDRMAELTGASMFVTGHQPQETGWKLLHRNMLVIASDHNHGVLLCVDLERSYSGEELTQAIVPLAGIV
jgi:hypothetical protein